MAEFVQTMKDWRRMCKAYTTDDAARCCQGCPMSGWGCGAIYDDGNADQEVIEREVNQWAAEHPEPVYPTWGEYLASIGVMKPAQPDKVYEVWFTQLYSTNIQADIAQKLGLHPKEGV